jgi:hypothetical protein
MLICRQDVVQIRTNKKQGVMDDALYFHEVKCDPSFITVNAETSKLTYHL